MAFGTFTLTGHFDAFGEAPASGKVRIDGLPQVVKDTAGNKIKVGPKTVVLDTLGDFSVDLPSDATTGNSTTIGFRVTADLKGLAGYGPVEFYARPIGQSVDLADLTPDVVVPTNEALALAERAEAAAADAQFWATIAQQAAEASGGIGYDVILAAGQSNMVGYGSPSDPALDTVDGRIWQFAQSGPDLNKVIAANDPLWHEQGQIGVGHAMSFARKYVQSLPQNRQVLIVPYAHGSTHFSTPNSGFGTWNPDNVGTAKNLAQGAVAATNAAIAKSPNNHLVAILWHQGEGSATAGNTQSEYAAYWDELEDYFRANITGASSVPIVLGGMMPEGVDISPAKAIIRQAHLDIPARRPLTAYWDGVRGYVQTGSDDHYNAAGGRLIGQGPAFDAYQRALTNTAGTAPGVPASITVTAATTTATATWAPSSGRVTGYDVEASVNGGAFTAITHTTMETTEAKTGLVAGNTIAFRVRAKGPSGTSAYRTSTTVSTVSVPGQVTGLTAGTATSTTQPLTWTATATATSYVVQRSAAGAASWSTVASPVTNAATVSGLTPSTAYDYRVAAVNAAGQGAYSATVTATTAAPAPLVNEVGVTPFYAHSLRKLVSTYAGSAVKVRRSSDNTTQDIGFVGNNLDTAALLTFAGAGDAFVDTWYDQSGNNRHAVQTTNVTFQPKVVAAGSLITRNSKPYMTFDGTNDFFADAVTGLYAAGAATALTVLQGSGATAAAQSTIVGETGAATATNYGLLNHGVTFRALSFIRNDANTVFANSGNTGALLTGSPHTVTDVDTGTQLTLTVDGNPAVVTPYDRTGQTLTPTGRAIGRLGSGFFNGDMTEVVAWNVALNSTQSGAAAANAKAYYGTA